MFIDLAKYVDLDHYGVYPVCVATSRGTATMFCLEWNGCTIFKTTTIDIYDDTAFAEFIRAMFQDFVMEIGR